VAAVLIVGATIPGFIIHASGQQNAASAPVSLEPYIELELARVDEAYALIGRFGQQVWPGWDNYLEPEFYVNFPNNVQLLVGSPDHAPEGFERVAGRSLHDKAVYINRKSEVPIKLTQLMSTGGNGGPSVQIYLAQWPNDPHYVPTNDGGISEAGILVNVHELFHCFQYQFEVYEAGSKALEALEKASGPFVTDLNYTKWSSVEGRALLGAYDAKDVKSMRQYLKDYLAARHEKQKGMPAFMVAKEENTQLSEGTAEYANDKMAMLVRDATYAGTGALAGDPLFFKFAHMDDYLKHHLHEQTTYSMDSTMDSGMKYYQYGALESLVLDRLAPHWKKNFFQSGKTLDDVASKVLKLKPADEEQIKARLSAKYNMAEIEAKHRPAIEKRDQALASVANRKGRHYVIDFSKLPKNDLTSMQRDFSKEMIMVGPRFIYPHGLGQMTLEQVELTTGDTPIDNAISTRTFEWIDTESKPGEKGYELEVGSQDGDVLKDVVLTTKGFTLKVPEVQLIEDKEKDEVRVLILSKVKR
jgi:hypothetical protein